MVRSSNYPDSEAFFASVEQAPSPDQIRDRGGGVKFNVAVQQGDEAGGPLAVPATRRLWGHQTGVGKYGGARRFEHCRCAHSRQTALGEQREAHRVENIRISHPLIDFVGQTVGAALVTGTRRAGWIVPKWGSADRSRSAELQFAAPVVRLGPIWG